MTFYYNTAEPDFSLRFRLQFKYLGEKKEMIYLCIGTDKITGDSLGPYIGTLLKKRGLCVYGTLGSTVNATNLTENIARIHREHPDPFIVAIDACLGRREHIGYVTLAKGSLKAGSGVNKQLMPVGSIAIKGIVSEFSPDCYGRLMNVPEEKIEHMGRLIVDSLV